MKSNYGKGCQLPEFKQIFPAEAFKGEPSHDRALFAALLASAKLIPHAELTRVAGQTPHHIRQQVAVSCRKIVDECQGAVWLQ